MRLLSLFSGIGAFEKALENLGEPFDLVNYCEIDKYASKAFTLIHHVDESMNLKDVYSVKPNELPKDIDLITYGFPCQDISISGKQRGFFDGEGLTRSGLFFKAYDIIKQAKPKIAIAENVKALTSKKFAQEFKIVLDCLKYAGYKNYYAVLNSENYGIPQNRERVFIISIRDDIDHGFMFPKKQELKLRLFDMLEKNVDEKYFVSKKTLDCILATGTKSFYYKPEIDLEIARPLTATMHKSHRASQDNYVSESFVNYGKKMEISDCLLVKEATSKGFKEAHDGDYVNIQFPKSKTRRERIGKQIANTLLCSDANGVVTKDLRIRKLTPKECFRLMGFDDKDCDILIENGISNTQLYKMAGNSIVVNVLENIFKSLFAQYSELFSSNIKIEKSQQLDSWDVRSDWESRQITIFDILN